MTYTPRKLILLAGDFICLNLALLLTLIIRYPSGDLENQWQSHWPYFLPVFIIWLIILYISDLYNLNFAGNGSIFYRSLLSASLASTILSSLYFYLNLHSSIAPRTNLIIFLIVFLILFYFWRRSYYLLTQRFLPSERLAIIGSKNSVERLAEEIEKNQGSGYRAELKITDPEQLDFVQEMISLKKIESLVVVEDFISPSALSRFLADCWRYEIAVFDYASFYEYLTGKVPIETIGPTWFLKNVQTRQKRYYDWSKQIVDAGLAILLAIISSPLWLAVTLYIKLSTPGRVLFTQKRLGRDGQPFIIIKFRTMTENDDPSQRQLITGGDFLRATRLDELPQLINILKGEMSFIGPRPEQEEIAAQREQEIPFYRMRLLVKPGLTGWDQISGDYHSSSLPDTIAKLQHDLFYLKQRSIYLDCAIALKTIATIFSRNGR